MLKLWWRESLPRLRSHVNGIITDSTVVAVHSFPATGELEAALVFQPMRCLRDRRVPNCHVTTDQFGLKTCALSCKCIEKT
jgi:hypothetical protein